MVKINVHLRKLSQN